MTRFVVRITPWAELDAGAIVSYLSTHSSQGAANWYAAFCRAVDSLELHPTAYGLAAESMFLGREIRERFFKTANGRYYRLLYTISDGEVRIFFVRGPGQPPIETEEGTDRL